ncbi:hypothetical protein ACTXJ2_11170 [Psychrobacter alimentarius]|uniref:hypothetical protein n=1 Tax=Psychrobacter TaxID=497 RepID=UPI000BAA9C9E|nr:hypothetical protein [Psychrobacter sp. JB193]PAT64659.1 hypothetical protein CIK80_06190 [Psychrobacter sp. JB193]
MSSPTNDSCLVKSIKWLERHVLEFFKTIEGLVLFLIGIIFTPSFGSFMQIIRDDSIPYSKVLENKAFYILFLILPLYILFIYKNKKKRDKEVAEINALINEKMQLSLDVEEKDKELNEIKQNLNDAQEAITDLKTQHLSESREITSRFLAFLSKKLGFTPNERISLYMLISVDSNIDEQDFLHIFGRYSVNVSYNKTNRLRFPKDEGVIGKAFVSSDTNTSTIHLSGNDNQYLKETKTFGIKMEVARKFNMQSRSFYPYMITKNLGDRIGVLLCESTTVNQQFDLAEINRILDEHDSIILELLDYNRAILNKTIVSEDKI